MKNINFYNYIVLSYHSHIKYILYSPFVIAHLLDYGWDYKELYFKLDKQETDDVNSIMDADKKKIIYLNYENRADVEIVDTITIDIHKKNHGNI